MLKYFHVTIIKRIVKQKGKVQKQQRLDKDLTEVRVMFKYSDTKETGHEHRVVSLSAEESRKGGHSEFPILQHL